MKTSRRRAREFALQALFQMDLTDEEDPDRVLPDFWERGNPREEVRRYAEILVRGTLGSLDRIDPLIIRCTDHWRLDRMSTVDRSILRMAVFETMLADTPTPAAVVIDEAVELAKQFGTEQSGRFVNGVLDQILKSHNVPSDESGQDATDEDKAT